MNKKDPLVSVLVPCYNHEQFVEETITSIVQQTYKNIELIVIDDGSSDNSPQVIKKLKEKYGFYFEHQSNMGLSATLNKMIKMAQGEYISIIASDDICTVDKIEILVENMKNLSDQYALVCGNAGFIDDKGDKICLGERKKYCNFIDFYLLHNNRDDVMKRDRFGSYDTFIQGNYIPAMSVMVRKKVLEEVGLYDETLRLEDLDMWLKISKKYKFYFIDKIVSYYRWHESNSVKVMRKALLKDELSILERERAYCLSVDYGEVWKQKYYRMILGLMNQKKFWVLKYINFQDVAWFSYFVGKEIKNCFLRKIYLFLIKLKSYN